MFSEEIIKFIPPRVVPNIRRNKAMKALTLSYPRSSAIAVTGLPAARSSRALSSVSAVAIH